MKMKIARDDIAQVVAHAGEIPWQRPAPVASMSSWTAKTNAPAEINVIGQNVDDATREVEKFVDRAFLAGCRRVRVVHGSGMGILRKALRSFLQKHPHVASVTEPPQNRGRRGRHRCRLAHLTRSPILLSPISGGSREAPDPSLLFSFPPPACVLRKLIRRTPLRQMRTKYGRPRSGNQRFVGGQSSQHDYVAQRQALAKTQAPKVAVLGCADSRLSPELLFDKGLGDLFVVRNAGNSPDPIAIGSLDA